MNQLLAAAFLTLLAPLLAEPSIVQKPPDKLRIATYNVSFYRDKSGQLLRDLRTGNDPAALKIAEVIQRIRPDAILLNEIDYDPTGHILKEFQEKYLGLGQAGLEPIEFSHTFTAPVNTGEPTGIDLNQNGIPNEADDAWGFGHYSGQYGMAVLSKYPIDRQAVRTFQNLKWSLMPGAKRPIDPQTGNSFHPDNVWKQLRLSSKSFWDVPILLGERRLHLLCSHPTPPVYDGPEDRNGCRNFDEIRMVADYITPERADYLVDDRGTKGGLTPQASFVILGDLNADPVDGDSSRGAIQQLLDHPRVNARRVPASKGGVAAVLSPALIEQRGDPSHDTGAFSEDGSFNLRADYALPSRDLKVLDTSVFWPARGEPGAEAVTGTDHRAVWVEVGL